MALKKFVLLALFVCVLASLPAFANANASAIQAPSYNQVTSDASTITGTSSGALLIKATFPDGKTASTTAKNDGFGWSWSVPVYGTLKERDRIRLDYGANSYTNRLYINVSSAGAKLGGPPVTSNANTATSSTDATGNVVNNAPPNTSANNAPSQQVVNARPLLVFVAALFVIALSLTLLIRAFWRRRHQE